MGAADVQKPPLPSYMEGIPDLSYNKELARPDGTSPISRFFAGTSIFLTGGTGFMGKVFLQKIMRCAPDIKVFYVLIRTKRGKEPSQRFDELVEDKLFECMKDVVPDWRSKVHLVVGDVSEKGLGLSDADREMLCANVDIMVHGAATVRFDEALKKAIAINVRGTKEMFDLAHRMPHLKVFCHVSTAYSHCVRPEINEEFYEPAIPYDVAIRVMETMDDPTVSLYTPHILGDYPNTYAFTKSLAENVARKEGQDLPLVVFRPAMVISTLQDPIPGWVDNIYGPMGISLGAGVGLLRVLHCEADNVANLVPVDMTVNALIAAIWDKACNNDKTNSVAKTQLTQNDGPSNAASIYNYVSSNEVPLTWREYQHMIEDYGLPYPVTQMVWYYMLLLVPHRITYLILIFFLHWIPALIADFALRVSNKKPMMLNAYRKIHKFSAVTAYFSTRSWDFANQNVVDLWSRLDDRDKKIFYFEMASLDWVKYFKTFSIGGRVFLLKDDLSTLPECRKKWNRLYWMHQGLKVILLALLVWIVFRLI